MTYYVATRKLAPSKEIVIVPYDAGPLESVAGFKAGDTLTLRDVLYGLLVASGNDAAATLALAVSGSEPDFVARMNAAARELGLRDTTYTDPIGLDPGDVSSARDLVDLAIELRKRKLFRRIVDTPWVTLRSGTKPIRLENRNDLVVERPYVDGVKTGTTLDAGYVLVASADRNGIELVSALLGAPDDASRDSATLALLDYGFSLYSKRTLVKEAGRVGAVPLEGGDGSLALVAARGVHEVSRADQDVAVELDAPSSVKGPIAKGDPVGTARVSLDGTVVAEVDAVAARAMLAPAEADDDSSLPGWALAVFAVAGFLAVALAAVAVAIHRRGAR